MIESLVVIFAALVFMAVFQDALIVLFWFGFVAAIGLAFPPALLILLALAVPVFLWEMWKSYRFNKKYPNA